MRRELIAMTMGIALTMCFSSAAMADPIQGRDTLKFLQEPMLNTPIITTPGAVEVFHGHDELSTAYSVLDDTGTILGYRGPFMADDFADRFSTPVVHVKWWGSYMDLPSTNPDRVDKFLISFEEDVPHIPGQNEFSHPGDPLLNQIVRLDTDGVLTPGEGTFTEKPVAPVSVDGPIYEYNAELHLGKEFVQKPDTVYWLKIVALVDRDPNTPTDQLLKWGWHNRDYTKPNFLASPLVVPGERPQGPIPNGLDGGIPVWHFQDDAVSGIVAVRFDPEDPMTRIMPLVQQGEFNDQNYLPPFDGPSLIFEFSKDLAFALYTVPEPSTLMLGVLALAGWAGGLRRRRS